MSRSLRVQIAGLKLAVRSDAKPKYVRELAAMVEERIAQAQRGGGRTATPQALALLAAMSIADDLRQLEEAHRELKREIRERSERILKHLDREAQAS